MRRRPSCCRRPTRPIWRGCGSSRPGSRCRSPAIPRSARRSSWHGWVGCRTIGEFVLEEQAGPVPVRLRPSDGACCLRRVLRPAGRDAWRAFARTVARGGARARACRLGDLGWVAMRRQLRRALRAGRARQPRGPGQGHARRPCRTAEWCGRGAPVHPGDRRCCGRPPCAHVRARAWGSRGSRDGECGCGIGRLSGRSAGSRRRLA